MTKKYTLKQKPLIISIALLSLAGAAFATPPPEISKPKGAMGSGEYVKGQAKTNQFWWPEQLNLAPLRDHDERSNPYGADFDYAEAFARLDMSALKHDLKTMMTNSQDWWPADWGHYGPLFIRLSWHSAGTYRTLDGRGGGEGGQMRFDPLNSWPDNGNLDKAKRLLWPIKQKYGSRISWGDLMVLAGTVALEDMGFKTYGFAGGRTDDWEPDLVYWGPEVEMLASDRHEQDGELKRPLGATHMGLIYVNPEGPRGKPDPLGSAKNIRIAFERMAMNDEETVALIAGGHTFGKMHGAHKAAKCLAGEPGSAGIEEQGLGWKNSCGKGHSEDTTTSGLEGAWTQAPTQWTTLYLQNLLNFDWQQVRSPAGAIQWVPSDESLHQSVPDAHVEGKLNPPVMTTADLALKFDPVYKKIAQRFLANPEEYRLAFAKAWFKLTHRDMGPSSRYLGTNAPSEKHIWQDPVPTPSHTLIGDSDVEQLKQAILNTGLTRPELVRTAWASAASFRASDRRGGANGARIALAPQKDWAINNPTELDNVLTQLRQVQIRFNNKTKNGKQVSLADVIVLAGAAAIEQGAKEAGIDLKVPFVPGRGDARQAHTDVQSFALLEPKADGFRNYFNAATSYLSPTEMLVDRAEQLNLTVPEMTVLVGGLRVMGGNSDNSQHGVFTDNVGVLSNDFFVNLLDMSTRWQKSDTAGLYEGYQRNSGQLKYTATGVDLIFGSNSELRAVAEVYAFDESKQKFAEDFAQAWTKVMQLDRFELQK